MLLGMVWVGLFFLNGIFWLIIMVLGIVGIVGLFVVYVFLLYVINCVDWFFDFKFGDIF